MGSHIGKGTSWVDSASWHYRGLNCGRRRIEGAASRRPRQVSLEGSTKNPLDREATAT